MSGQSPPGPTAATCRLAAVRRNAAQRVECTVICVQERIAALTRACRPIAGPPFKQETGLEHKTIQAKRAAHAPLCKHAAHFAVWSADADAATAWSRGWKPAHTAVQPPPTPRDPPLQRPKRAAGRLYPDTRSGARWALRRDHGSGARAHIEAQYHGTASPVGSNSAQPPGPSSGVQRRQCLKA